MAGTVAAVAGTAVAAVGVAGIAADTTAVVGIIRQAGIDGTGVGAGGAAVTTRGGYCRYLFRGLTRITVITVLGMDRVTDTDTDTDTEYTEYTERSMGREATLIISCLFPCAPFIPCSISLPFILSVA